MSPRLADRTRTAFVTICAWNYLHYALTWLTSVRAHQPGVDAVLVVADRWRGDLASFTDQFDRVIGFEELAGPDPEALAFRYTVMELSTAIKPVALLRLLSLGYDQLLYFDPDIRLFAPVDPLLHEIRAGATSLLTPHSLSPNEEATSPNDLTFLGSGAYNLGFLALRKCPDVERTLEWWARRLEKHCVANRLQDGLFVDQKWMDLWPSYCAGTSIVRDPGYNVAYWNLDERQLSLKDDRWMANGVPLRFFHFSGIVPGRRDILSKYQVRWSPDDSPLLSRILSEYQDQLETHGRDRFASVPYGYGEFENGEPIPDCARWFFREALEPFKGNPFELLPQICNAAAENIGTNPNGVVTRLAHHFWRSHAHLREAFDIRSKAGKLNYAEWFVRNARTQAGIGRTFTDVVRARLATAPHAHLPPSRRSLRERVHMLAGPIARHAYHTAGEFRKKLGPAYDLIPVGLRRSIGSKLMSVGWPSEFAATRRTRGVVPKLAPGVTLVGYPFAELGVGEAMRSLARSSVAASIPTRVYNFDIHVVARQADRSLAGLVTDRFDHRVNVFCVNADLLGHTLKTLGPDVTRARYNIVRPFWELGRLPDRWDDTLSSLDEIWAPTEFVRKAFAERATIPVVHIPVAVTIPPFARLERRRFGLPDDVYMFLFAFDMASYPSRKNPFAAIDAFERAFGKSPRGVGLVIKAMGQDSQRAETLGQLAARMNRNTSLYLLDGTLTREETIGLIETCDAFVSLHRSEGFGLGIAEAMLLGKPVVATDYSGNTDFMDVTTGFPVPARLIEVGEDEYPYYEPGQLWADPDIDAAAATMANLVKDPELGIGIGKRARAYISTRHSPDEVGRQVRARLQDLGLLGAEMEGDAE